MGARWQKNELTQSKRRCDLRPASAALGSVAPRETDFTGYVYITQDGVDYVLGVGTVANKRRALVVADDVFTATHGTDTLTAVAHGLETGDGPFWISNSGGSLPTLLTNATNYWIIRVDDDNFQLALSLALAYAGTEQAFDDNGTGTHTISDVATTQRGVDGEFTYTATQAETNYDTAEIAVSILGHATYEGYTTVEISGLSDDLGGVELESGITRDDAWRILLRGEIALYSKTGNDYVIRDIADSKDSHHGTVTTIGRTVAVIDDPT